MNIIDVGGGTNGISEFVDGLRLAARQIGGGKETSTRHKRKRSGLPLLEGTLALGYTYIDILDEENDGTDILTMKLIRYSCKIDLLIISESLNKSDTSSSSNFFPITLNADNLCNIA